eukprot:CAMPEP_0114383832 /NCGR_PEP_ID=MMETSP0102-20121206/4981_1 /TAXON_ID=38822 ORGANISM="Pteridomonas danica, Strain PT" /NCGR_SAMPLE_ID=MMETSP0102 /ASSEMBLY_ACC=CAM_ASM_000212 /LENGTH=431 /DNA_ID=CAMNT_0001539983 /DNA_START=19 /DNA_END=1313 /DNA_ORIENTATION=-
MTIPTSELERTTLHITVALRNAFVVASYDASIPVEKTLRVNGEEVLDKVRLSCPFTSKESHFDNSHPWILNMRSGYVEAEEVVLAQQKEAASLFHEDSLNQALLKDPNSSHSSHEELFWAIKRGLEVLEPVNCSSFFLKSLISASQEAVALKRSSADHMEEVLKVLMSMAAARDKLQRRTDGVRRRRMLGLPDNGDNGAEEECDDVEEESDDQYMRFLSRLCETFPGLPVALISGSLDPGEKALLSTMFARFRVMLHHEGHDKRKKAIKEKLKAEEELRGDIESRPNKRSKHLKTGVKLQAGSVYTKIKPEFRNVVASMLIEKSTENSDLIVFNAVHQDTDLVIFKKISIDASSGQRKSGQRKTKYFKSRQSSRKSAAADDDDDDEETKNDEEDEEEDGISARTATFSLLRKMATESSSTKKLTTENDESK